jgi:hypothetical protein
MTLRAAYREAQSIVSGVVMIPYRTWRRKEGRVRLGKERFDAAGSQAVYGVLISRLPAKHLLYLYCTIH